MIDLQQPLQRLHSAAATQRKNTISVVQLFTPVFLLPDPDQRPVQRYQKHQDRRLYGRKNEPDF
jgi:hypothetical protein